MAPAIPPTRLGTMSARKRGSAAPSSRRYPQALPTVPGQMATVEVALAVTESRPSQISVGNDTSVPPPATELMEPATKAAPKETAACGRSSPEGKPQDTAGSRSAPKFAAQVLEFTF